MLFLGLVNLACAIINFDLGNAGMGLLNMIAFLLCVTSRKRIT